MSFAKQTIDDLERRDQFEPEYLCDDSEPPPDDPWPSEEEMKRDAERER